MLGKLVLLLVALSVPNSFAATDKVVCFHASWARYRQGDGAFTPEDIAADLCTHVFYAFLGVDVDGTISILDSWSEVDLGGLEKVSALKQINPKLKTLISIGGWNAGNAILNGVAASAKLRANLVNSSIEFFKTWGYDGLDIDWEYPQDSDKKNFVTLLKELRTAFDEEGYLLSVTVPGIPLSSYDIPAISEVVDLLNLMSYDYHGVYDGVTGHNAPLYGATKSDVVNVNSSVHAWLDGGAKAETLTLSLPFYGHSFTLTDESDNGVGAPASPGIGGPYTQSPGTLGYNEICDLYGDWTRQWDDVQKVPYKVSDSNWASYDDEDSVILKVEYAKSLGLAGLAIWSVDTDDFKGNCGPDHGLLRAINDNL